ncbi:hypothetical protein MASSI9I_70058 [Massilia sp. 9I]|nr:hypothetical protein MASSI9I_70058 [Massilia sp. 9I]
MRQRTLDGESASLFWRTVRMSKKKMGTVRQRTEEVPCGA